VSDVFISYAHLDNRPLSEGQKGWIEDFHRVLDVRLAQWLGEGGTKIWRDPKLSGNDVFDETILRELLQAKVLVSVVSPRYVKSDWCKRELKTFCETAQQNGDLFVKNKSRVFKVVKLPPPPEEAHFPPPAAELFQRVLGYEFFIVDPASGRPRELAEIFGEDMRRAYYARIDDLAYDINQLLRELLRPGAPAQDAPAAKAVYLADTGADLKEQRDTIKRELLTRGYQVLPEQALPTSAAELETRVRADLEQCQFSIHLIGASAGWTPEGASRSVVEWLNALAAERSAGTDFARLIWLPKGLAPRDPRQAEFVSRLLQDAALQQGAEVLETTVEELKTIMLDQLTRPQKAKATIYLAETTFDLKERRAALPCCRSSRCPSWAANWRPTCAPTWRNASSPST